MHCRKIQDYQTRLRSLFISISCISFLAVQPWFSKLVIVSQERWVNKYEPSLRFCNSVICKDLFFTNRPLMQKSSSHSDTDASGTIRFIPQTVLEQGWGIPLSVTSGIPQKYFSNRVIAPRVQHYLVLCIRGAKSKNKLNLGKNVPMQRLAE